MSYIVIKWSQVVDLIQQESFIENSHPILDEKGRAKYEDGAFFINEEWLEIYYRHKNETDESLDKQNNLSEKEILEIIDSLKIEPNPYTRGEMCKFKVRENYYYASRCLTFDHGMECMIFSTDEKGNVIDWTDLYASRELSIIESIKDFLRSL